MSTPETFRADWPDRTKRAWDQIKLHLDALGDEAAGHWVAIRMSDGGSDGVLYPSKTDASAHQLHDRQCAYLLIHPFCDMSVGEVHRFLTVNERIYDAGGRLEDAGTHIVPTAQRRGLI